MESEQIFFHGVPIPRVFERKNVRVATGKVLLYALLLTFFVVAGGCLGGAVVTLNSDYFLKWTVDSPNLTDTENFWKPNSFLIYISGTLLVILGLQWGHQYQGKLTCTLSKYGRLFAYADWLFSILNVVGFCFGIVCGYGASILGIGWSSGPP